MDSLRQDLKYALRALARRPSHTAAVLFFFAIGVGATVATFSVVDVLLFRPPPHVRDVGQLVRARLEWSYVGGGRPPTLAEAGLVSYEDVRTLAAVRPALADVGAYATRELTVGTGPGARARRVGFATASFFSTLGVQPLLGRWFASAPSTGNEAVISHEFWREVLGASPLAIGMSLRVGSRPCTIVGIAPPDFRGVDLLPAAVWLPVDAARYELFAGNREALLRTEWLSPVARLRSDIPAGRAAEDASSILQRAYAERFGARLGAFVNVVLEPIVGLGTDGIAAGGTKVSLLAAGMSILLLLITCIDVVGLRTAHALSRRRETAVRYALGAGRAALLRQRFIEDFVLTAAGAAIGVAFAGAAERGLVTLLLPGAAYPGLGAARRALLLAATLAIIVWIGSGIGPVVRASRRPSFDDLRAGSVEEPSAARPRTRTLMLVGQLSMTLVLLVVSGLFLRSFANARGAQLGFEADRLVVANFQVANSLDTADARAAAVRALTNVRAIPGVEHAALAIGAPFIRTLQTPAFGTPGREADASGRPDDRNGLGLLQLNAISPEYFVALGQRLLRGRAFEDLDRGDTRPVVVISDVLARRLWPPGGDDALGQCLLLDAPGAPAAGGGGRSCREIVGVVAPTHVMQLRERALLQAYVPLTQWMTRESYVVVARGRGPVAPLVNPIRAALMESIPAAPYLDVETYRAILDPTLGPWRLGSALFLAFGVLALLLSTFGLYAAFAETVARRTKEIGIRMALGADAATVRRLVLRDASRIIGAGAVIGAGLAVLTGRALSSLLFGVSGVDPLTLGVVILLLAAAVAVAVLANARRATRVDPLVALHHE